MGWCRPLNIHFPWNYICCRTFSQFFEVWPIVPPCWYFKFWEFTRPPNPKSGACYGGVMFPLLWVLPHAKGHQSTTCRQFFIIRRSLVELVGIFLCPLMKVVLIDAPKSWKRALSVITRQVINSIWYKISRDRLDKHLQLCCSCLLPWLPIFSSYFSFFLSSCSPLGSKVGQPLVSLHPLLLNVWPIHLNFLFLISTFTSF